MSTFQLPIEGGPAYVELILETRNADLLPVDGCRGWPCEVPSPTPIE